MSTIKSLPYLVPKPERIQVDAWQIEIDGTYELLTDALPTWDPAMPIRAVCSANLDVPGILMDCCLSDDAELRLGVGWYSRGSNLKGSGSHVQVNRVDDNSVRLQLDVNGDLLAQQIILQTTLILVAHGSADGKLAPKFPGSLLWEQEKPVYLEGMASRFPMELIDFESANWLPSSAAWFLDWNPDDFRIPFTAGVRLYINSKNDRVRTALTGGPSDDVAIREAVFFDVARLLISSALMNKEFSLEKDQFKQGELGFAVAGLIRMIFPHRGIEQLKELLETPNQFDVHLQHGLQVFTKKTL